MKFTTRQLATLAVFGTLWGIVEISLGSVLNALRVPLSGTVLAAIGLLIAITGRLFVPQRGSTFFIGVISMIIKLFSLGGVVIGPMIGILAEATIAEVVLSIRRTPSRLIFIVAGGLGVLWTLIHPFFTGLLIFGRDFIDIWMALIEEGARLFGWTSAAAIGIVSILAGLRLVIGGATGWLAWDVGNRLRGRLAGAPRTADGG